MNTFYNDFCNRKALDMLNVQKFGLSLSFANLVDKSPKLCFGVLLFLILSLLITVEKNPGPRSGKSLARKARNLKNEAREMKILHSRRSQPVLELTNEYVKSLVDPFENVGCYLGFGCMVPTSLVTAYVRGTVAANADGSLALAALPGVGNGMLIGNGGLAVSFTTSADTQAYYNKTAIQASYETARVISIGLRAFPSIAATSAPGICYTGALPQVNFTDLTLFTPTDLGTLIDSHMGIGTSGGSSTGRPIDPSSFVFAEQVIGTDIGYNNAVWTAQAIPFSIPYVAFTGLPASAVVSYEVVLNLEATPIMQHAAGTSAITGASVQEATLATEWPTVDRMWSKLSKFLPPSGREGSWMAASDSTALTVRAKSAVPKSGSFNFGQAMEMGAKALNYGGQLARFLKY